jgi:phosphatidylserine synthase
MFQLSWLKPRTAGLHCTRAWVLCTLVLLARFGCSQTNKEGNLVGLPISVGNPLTNLPISLYIVWSASWNCLFCRSIFERVVEGNEYVVSVPRRLFRTGISCPSSSVWFVMILLCPPLIVFNRVRKIVGWFIIQAACCHSLRLRHRCIHLEVTSGTYVELNGSNIEDTIWLYQF